MRMPLTNLGAYMRRRRQELHMTSREAAKKASLPRYQDWSDWEIGKKIPKETQLSAIADALNVNVTAIIELHGQGNGQGDLSLVPAQLADVEQDTEGLFLPGAKSFEDVLAAETDLDEATTVIVAALHSPPEPGDSVITAAVVGNLLNKPYINYHYIVSTPDERSRVQSVFCDQIGNGPWTELLVNSRVRFSTMNLSLLIREHHEVVEEMGRFLIIFCPVSAKWRTNGYSYQECKHTSRRTRQVRVTPYYVPLDEETTKWLVAELAAVPSTYFKHDA